MDMSQLVNYFFDSCSVRSLFSIAWFIKYWQTHDDIHLPVGKYNFDFSNLSSCFCEGREPYIPIELVSDLKYYKSGNIHCNIKIHTRVINLHNKSFYDHINEAINEHPNNYVFLEHFDGNHNYGIHYYLTYGSIILFVQLSPHVYHGYQAGVEAAYNQQFTLLKNKISEIKKDSCSRIWIIVYNQYEHDCR